METERSATFQIRTSDRATFKKCRRRWDYSSPIRRNLRPKIEYEGVSFPLAFGTAVHTALELYYDPVLSQDPVANFHTEWFVLMHDVKSRTPEWFEQNETTFQQHYELGVGMMDFYLHYAKKNDGQYKVIAAEHEFEVPLFGNATYNGRMDAIIQDLDDGRYWVWDHKTTSALTDDYFQKLEMDEQCSSYIWAAQHEDAPYSGKIAGVIYNVLAKGFPKRPTILDSGRPSLNRATEYTTAELFREAVATRGLHDWLATNEKAQAYLHYLEQAGDERFIRREKVIRNQHEIASLGQRIRWEAWDMLDDPFIYPNPTGEWYCLKCPFRAPCLAANDGSDEEGLLEANYVTRT